jgi:hypothetical protein
LRWDREEGGDWYPHLAYEGSEPFYRDPITGGFSLVALEDPEVVIAAFCHAMEHLSLWDLRHLARALNDLLGVGDTIAITFVGDGVPVDVTTLVRSHGWKPPNAGGDEAIS